MNEAKMDAWMREHGFMLDADGKMIPAVNSPDGWRELVFAPIPKGMFVIAPRRPKEEIRAEDVPDCSRSLPSLKAELVGFMEAAIKKTPIKTLEAAAKWRTVFEAANLDACLLDGVTDDLARRCTVRAILHLLCRFSTFVKASEGEISREEALASFRGLDSRLGRIEDRLTRNIIPPSNQAWWKNLHTRFEDEPGLTKTEKWLSVARMVVTGAINEMCKPARDRRIDYLTPRMLDSLIRELKTGSKAEIEKKWAYKLSRYVRREVQKAN